MIFVKFKISRTTFFSFFWQREWFVCSLCVRTTGRCDYHTWNPPFCDNFQARGRPSPFKAVRISFLLTDGRADGVCLAVGSSRIHQYVRRRRSYVSDSAALFARCCERNAARARSTELAAVQVCGALRQVFHLFNWFTFRFIMHISWLRN